MKNLLFLGGVHGSGKNFLLENTASEIPVTFLTASEVLKWKKFNNFPDNKQVSSISQNQNILIKKLNTIIKPNKFYVLDGHFTLLNSLGNISRVPEDTFSQISPKALIIKTSAPQIICSRLQKRDNQNWDINLISEIQKQETAYAEELSEKLKIPLYKIEDGQNELLNKIIQREFPPAEIKENNLHPYLTDYNKKGRS